jgi:hypothetical protein
MIDREGDGRLVQLSVRDFVGAGRAHVRARAARDKWKSDVTTRMLRKPFCSRYCSRVK